MSARRSSFSFVLVPLVLVAGASLVGPLPGSAAAETPEQLAAKIFDETGVQGGFVVHLPSGDGQLTAALRPNDRYQVQGLDRDADQIAAARRHIDALGAYGPVSVDRLQGDRLPYVDNLVNLLVIENAAGISNEEMLRVLTPGGVAFIKQDDGWRQQAKPVPADIDEWTHFLHDAGGNAVAHDDVVGPPRHLQWIGGPRWSRHHDRMASMSALVSSGGRIFYIMDEGSRVSIQMPPRWMVVARDAFNGTVLWKQPIREWQSHLWPLKSGPTSLARRLVAEGDRVYVTLGLREPVSVLDAATGEIVQQIKPTAFTEEFILAGGKLLALVNQAEMEVGDFTPAFNTGDQRRVREENEFHWNRKPRRVVAADPESGEVLWTHDGLVAPLTLASDGERVFLHDDQRVVCLDLADGSEVWASEPAGRRDRVTLNFGPKLVVHDGVVLFAGGDRTMRALEAATGKPMWQSPHARGGYESPEDLLVAGGLVWSAPTTSGRDSGIWTGRYLRTGELKVEFPPNIETYWFHHRCYIAKATDKFLMPSRTGVEFVDYENQDWDIHHWVRGGCLYGVMPCNGLLYAPPHNCACYPEAKLFGLNALAPASANRELPEVVSDEGRLEVGPAFGTTAAEGIATAVDGEDSEDAKQWPTYRRNAARSGYTPTAVPTALKQTWDTELGGKLSSVVVADGQLYVAAVDAHTVHALDADSGARNWSFTAGGRVDSPPTIDGERVLFGSADGWVYCLRASDGELVWRFRAAPRDERLMAFEQLESVWPVHGSVLVEKGVVYLVAGRSGFLDGGMRFLRLDAETGRKISEGLIDDVDPETGEPLQNRIQILQMPVALPDILSTDSVYVYLRSQQMDMEGNRLEIGPFSGDFATQGAVHRGESQHLFAPMGFLDDTWFHRSYWVYGRSFAGGHAGYYQAGKYTPSGRLLVFDDENVYGFGRKPEYLRWTTTIEHQLFASQKEPPPQAREAGDEPAARAAGDSATMIRVAKGPGIDPTNKPLTVEAWFMADRPDGVVLAHGGPQNGYALVLEGGKPKFQVRTDARLATAAAKVDTLGRWTHLVGVLQRDGRMQLFINGKPAAQSQAPALITAEPAQSLQIGADEGAAVGEYRSPAGFTGSIDEVRIYHAALDEAEVVANSTTRDRSSTDDPRLAVAFSFEGGLAEDDSGNGNHGTIVGAQSANGKFGRGMQFAFRRSRAAGSFVEHLWTQDVPLLVRAMVKAGDTLFIAGPPDLIDEEQTFQRLMSRDPQVAALLTEQDKALDGLKGGILWAVSAKDGTTLAEYELDTLPAWDGMASAYGRLFLSTTGGRVVCWGP